MALTKVPSNLDSITATTQSASDNSTNVATTAYVTTAVSNLVDGAPSTLNTLNEIAAALNDDAALNTTLTTSIADKLPLGGGTLVGTLTLSYDYPRINLTDTNHDSDYSIINNNGAFGVYDVTNAAYRLQINSSGNLTVSGHITASGTNNIYVGDNGKFTAGGGDDLQIYHDGTNSHIYNNTGYTTLRTAASGGYLYLHGDNVHLRGQTANETLLTAVLNGAVTLYHDNTAKLTTTSTGVEITGTLDVDVISNASGSVHLNDTLYFQDNSKAVFGDSSDLQIYHNGSHSFIDEQGTGGLIVRTGDFYVRNPSDADMIYATSGGAVKLYHNNSEKLTTGSSGVDVAGNIALTNSNNKSLRINSSTSNAGYLAVFQNQAIFSVNRDGKDGGFADTSKAAAVIKLNSAAADSNIEFQTTTTNNASPTTRLTIDKNGNATFNGTVTANAGVVVDNITIDGTTASISGSSDFTIDSGGRIDLSADDNGEVRLFDGSSMYAQFKDDDDRLKIQTLIQDKDMMFVGNDGGSEVTALSLDMSDGGAAIFNGNIALAGGADRRIQLSNSGTSGVNFSSNNTVHIRGDNDTMKLMAAGNGGFVFEENGTEHMRIASGGNVAIGTTDTSDVQFRVDQNENDDHTAFFKNTCAPNAMVGITFKTDSTVNAANKFGFQIDDNGNERFAARMNGSVFCSLDTYTSDIRLKENIEDCEPMLEKLKQVRIVDFDWKDGKGLEGRQRGVIAQEIEPIFPELIHCLLYTSPSPRD